MGIYDDIELTPQEQIEAILEGKKKKYFKEKNRAYWEAQERPKIVKGLPHCDEKQALTKTPLPLWQSKAP